MSLNRCMLIGNLKADATVRSVGTTSIASFTVATSEKWKDKNGQLQSSTEWHDCELWGQENVHKYLTKGQLVYVEGSIRTETWESNNGQKNSRKKIKVLSVQLLSTGNPRAQQQEQAAPQQQAPAQYQQPYQQPGYYPPQNRNSSFPQNQRVEDNDMGF